MSKWIIFTKKWFYSEQDISEEEGKKNKTKHQNRATTEVTERLLTLAAKRAAEKGSNKKKSEQDAFYVHIA